MKLLYVYLPIHRYPESCWHIVYAISNGAPDILTYCKNSKITKQNRRNSTSKLPPSPTKDRDEFPFACCYEGGTTADVSYISRSDNRGAGAYIGHQLRRHPDGTRFKIIIVL